MYDEIDEQGVIEGGRAFCALIKELDPEADADKILYTICAGYLKSNQPGRFFGTLVRTLQYELRWETEPELAAVQTPDTFPTEWSKP